MTVPSPLCWLRTVWHSLRSLLRNGHTIPIMGHSYRETFNGLAEVSVLECDECGHVSIGWTRLSEHAPADAGDGGGEG